MNLTTTITYKKLPVLGELGAGKGVEHLPIVEWREVRLPEWARPHDKFILAHVSGDSLERVGVFSGDYALIHLTKDVRQGDLAGVLVRGWMKIKFVYVERDGRVRLESQHERYPPQTYEPTEVDIQGRVIRTERDW